MKTKLEKCNVCNEETVHDIGKKLAGKRDKHYIRRTTRRCRKCGTKEINNSKKKTIIKGKNKSSEKNKIK